MALYNQGVDESACFYLKILRRRFLDNSRCEEAVL
jgi:hypothetical protein